MARTSTLSTKSRQGHFTYNPSDELLTMTNGKGAVTFWNYDEYGRVTNKVDVYGTNLFFYGYDALDRMTNRTSAAKGTTLYKYDALGNLTNVAYPASSNLTFRYDGLNRLTNMVDGVGATAFTWTDGGQLASEVGPWPSSTVSYTYNDRLRSGLTVSAPNASAWWQSYGYDEQARMTNVTSPAGAFGYAYADGHSHPGLVQTLNLPKYPMNIGNTYDSMGRLTSTYLSSPSLDEHDYMYDAGSERTQQSFIDGAYSSYVNYEYDNIGQLLRATGYEAGGTVRDNERMTNTYDAAWNVLTRRLNGLEEVFGVNSNNELGTVVRFGTLTVSGVTSTAATNATVNGLNATIYGDNTFAKSGITTVQAMTNFTAIGQNSDGWSATNTITVNLASVTNFVYDLNGNILTNGALSYAYDDENELTSVTWTNGWRSEFTYDGLMRRRIGKEYTWTNSAWLQTNEVHYVYDRMLVIQERDANNLPVVTYTRGNDLSGTFQGAGGIGGLLARTDNSKIIAHDWLNAHAYYHCDGNGHVTALVNTNGLVLARYHYDPFGNFLAMSGSLADANLYRFSSKEYHPNSGMYYYGYRFYDPNLQRWVNRDPINETSSINLFHFCYNDPISVSDSIGLDTYACNRQLMIFANPTLGPDPLPRADPLSHTFIFTANPNGGNMRTYSWGNNANKRGWNADQPEDKSAAFDALQLGFAEHLGDSSLDPFVGQAFNNLNKPSNEHANLFICNNCKNEANKLMNEARSLQAFAAPYNVGHENAPPITACNCH